MSVMEPVEALDEAQPLPIPHSTCPTCGGQVIITIGRHDQLRKVIDPTPVPGGLYDIESVYVDGVAVKRPGRDLYLETRAQASVEGGGLNPHPKHTRR